MSFIRNASVAGTFYPGDRETLQKDIQRFLSNAKPDLGTLPKALIVPHAGYVYSGQIAAEAFAQIKPYAAQIKKVVLLGPCHRVAVNGFAISSAEGFATPLGVIPLDQGLRQTALSLPGVKLFDATHEQEHSLEVQLPFLQEILSDFTLLPVVVGQTAPETVARFLDLLWGQDDTLIVISTDLSHYLDYQTCQRLDHKTAQAIEAFDINAIQNEQACGRIPLKGMLYTAAKRGMEIKRLSVKNSGDTAGPKDRVVGYGAWTLSGGKLLEKPTSDPVAAFSKETQQILKQYGGTFLKIAAASVKRGISHNEPIKVGLESFPDILKKNGACFVTLERKDGSLRGCIGSLQAHHPLVKDMADNAFKAGFKDPRFKPVTLEELSNLTIHISILSPSFAMSFKDEADFMSQIKPGRDGIIIRDQGKQALFLPSVWEKLPDKKMFIAHLKQKAGMASKHWSPTFEAFRFVTEGVHSQHLDDPDKLWQ